MKKYLSLILCIISGGYMLWYMHFGVPWTKGGALSKIGLYHRGYFIIWGGLTFIALAYALTLAYRRYLKTRAYIPLLSVCAAGMALTLMFDFDYDKMPDYWFHVIGSLAFSAVSSVTVFLLFLLCYKKGFVFKLFTCLTAATLITDTVLLLIFKETGLIESVPILLAYIMLCTVNLKKEKEYASR